MIDIDLRALQIRRMDEFKLVVLHRREREQGFRLMPWEIALSEKGDLKSFYGVPAKGSARRKALHTWSDTIRQVLGRFMRERHLNPSLDDLERLHAFDNAVHSSDLDFHFHTATPAKRVKDWFEP